MNWNEFKYGEQVYDLRHLRPYTTSFERPAKGELLAEKFSVNVTFSHHCFTRGLPKSGGTYDPFLLLNYPGDPRIFDERRWELSKQLPSIVENLPTCKCLRTGHGNFFTISLVAADGTSVEYEVFFRTWKPGRGKISLHVESAYVRDTEYGTSRPVGTSIGFFVILHNTLNCRPIHG